MKLIKIWILKRAKEKHEILNNELLMSMASYGAFEGYRGGLIINVFSYHRRAARRIQKLIDKIKES